MENKETLEGLRAEIDKIDLQLFALLQERLKIVGRVGALKKSQVGGKYIIRPGREALKVKKAFKQARDAGLDKKISQAVACIWREIISLSINFEEEANIVFNSAGSKETLWMLREYFGTYSTLIEKTSDQELLNSLREKKANIAAFNIERKPTSEPWWIELSKQTELSVFASVPLFPVNVKGADKLTLLVSNVTPEPCGEDKFIYVISKSIPADEKDTFEIISEYKGNYLVTSDEFYNNYQSKLSAKYLGCIAVFEF